MGELVQRRSLGRRAADAAIAAVAVACFLVLASTIDGDRASDLEETVSRALNGLPSVLAYPLWPLMQVGNLFALPVAAIAAGVLRRFRLAGALLVAMAIKLQITTVIKDRWVRHRPAEFLADVEVRLGGTRGGLGFVSGHAIIAVALGVLVHPYLRSRAHRVTLWACVALVLIGRVYVGAHLPLDVVCGGLVGAATGALLNLAFGVPRSSDEELTRSPRAP